MISILVLRLLISDVFEEASLYLGGIEGIRLEENVKGEVTLQGELERPSDLKKVKKFLRENPGVKNATSLSPEAGIQIEKSLQKRARLLVPNAQVSRKGAEFYLSGTDSASVLESLRQLYPSVQFAHLSSAKPAASKVSIFLEIALVEVKKSALRKLGTRIGSPIEITTNLTRQAFGADPIRGFLDLAMQKGEARMHAKQSIVAENGSKGTFMAGGEFPIKMVSGIVAKVEFKRFGMIVEFTPHLQGNRGVHLQIESEISDIDMGSMVDGIPVIVKKQIRTQVSANLNQMMAIGGLIHTTQSKMMDSIPGLSGIPVLGRLFESEDFKKNRSEAYLFITPRKMDEPWLPSPEL